MQFTRPKFSGSLGTGFVLQVVSSFVSSFVKQFCEARPPLQDELSLEARAGKDLKKPATDKQILRKIK